MPALRLTQQAEAQPDHYRVEIALEGAGARQSATAHFHFALSAQDQEDLRWYLEDYLQHPFEPERRIAARIERRMAVIGEELFRALFESSTTAQRLWARLQPELDETRVELVTEIREATAIPWELLRDPLTGHPLALEARAFVRSQTDQTRVPRGLDRSPLEAGESKIRILLVICRPRGEKDVPFRSVASRIVRSLTAEARDLVQLDVLRPPTFEQLGKTLRAAKRAGQPYHAIHFDGHGVYAQFAATGSSGQLLKQLNATTLGSEPTGKHGYLLFERPDARENMELVPGERLGHLMAETGVPLLVLNACQSAFAEPPERPVVAKAADPAGTPEEVRAFGSLAQEVMLAGATGVVAMRYVLYVETAKQFVEDLYDALVAGDTLGEAVTFGRKQLAAQPRREIGFKPIELQDWPVPVVYEVAPAALFPRPSREPGAPLRLSLGPDGGPEQGQLDPQLPRRPNVGFFGRDETLLALDRAFDRDRVVLLHAYAGSGKTATAAEFARWYALTGGIQGPVLFTSFEQYTPLARVLDQLEPVFGPSLEQAGIHWLALEDAQRRALALQILEQVPVLWIWDNVEPVAGFPAGHDSTWSAAEQQELADFLRAARETKAKFLLTSRRDERAWLGDLPRRITLPPMPMQERVQLARALAEKHGRRLDEVEDWRPLLRFTQGNPLTITVVVGQALREGLTTKAQIEAFVARLRAGEADIEDDEQQGRTKSLGASLSYGFQQAFDENERRILALLHLFRGFVDVDALRIMGRPTAEWSLPEVRGLTREAGIALLDRAAEIGLLEAHGGGYYTIHPALPWYFSTLFQEYYGTPPIPGPAPESGKGSGERALRAFVETMGELGNYYHNQYGDGNHNVIAALEAEEPNLLHARQLARRHGWWKPAIGTMQGLNVLYEHTGRRAEWRRLVEEIVPAFVDPATDGPLPGREDEWSLVIQYRVPLAEKARDWAKAERLQRALVEWTRRRAAPALAALDAGEALDDAPRNAVRSLAVSLHELGTIEREQGKAECAAVYQESLNLFERIGDRAGAATIAFNLGRAYENLPALRDLDEAERWYRRSLELIDERDRLRRSKCYGQLGSVAHERFLKARAAGRPETELLRHLNEAIGHYRQALDLLPPDAVNDLAVTYNQLGIIYKDAGLLDHALSHYREAIRYEEMQGNLYGAAQTRFAMGLALLDHGRLQDAQIYAQAALQGFEPYGAGVADDIEDARRLLVDIEQAIEAAGGGAGDATGGG